MLYNCQVFTVNFVQTAAFCVSVHHTAVNVPECGMAHCVHMHGDSVCYSEEGSE